MSNPTSFYGNSQPFVRPPFKRSLPPRSLYPEGHDHISLAKKQKIIVDKSIRSDFRPTVCFKENKRTVSVAFLENNILSLSPLKSDERVDRAAVN